MTDIYFGNGVWNTQKQAQRSTDELKFFMQYRAIAPLSIEDEKNKLYSFKHAYNPSRSTIDDLIETFWQIKESGQISDGYFFAIYSTLAAESNGQEFLQKLQTIISNYNGDVNAMYQLYTNASFSQKHNVLLVAHSQGNLFGNKMYTLFNQDQKAKFRMVSVATPANSVAGGGHYVTASGDYVINPIPGALPGNVDGFGHTFIGTYLNGSINAPRKIALYVKSAYNNLMQTTSCTEYWMTYMHMYVDGRMLVYGSPVGTHASEKIATVALPVTQSEEVYNNQGQLIGYTCGEHEVYWGDGKYFRPINENNLSWLPGTMYSKSTVEARKNINIAVKSQDSRSCIVIDNSKELYDVAINALSE